MSAFCVSSMAVVALILSSFNACSCVLSTDLLLYKNLPKTFCASFFAGELILVMRAPYCIIFSFHI